MLPKGEYIIVLPEMNRLLIILLHLINTNKQTKTPNLNLTRNWKTLLIINWQKLQIYILSKLKIPNNV